MLVIPLESGQRLVECFAEALDRGTLPQLMEKLLYLHTYCCLPDDPKSQGSRATLYNDLFTKSFGIEMQYLVDGKHPDEPGAYWPGWVGGLIYDATTATWGVHT